MVRTVRIAVQTRGPNDVVDLTPQVQREAAESRLADAAVHLFVVGSTAALTTIEYEPGLVEDFPSALERLAPEHAPYAHEAKWHDDNGHSHVRASLIGPSLTVPMVGGKLALGTWQQIVLVECDTRPRDRIVVIQFLGE